MSRRISYNNEVLIDNSIFFGAGVFETILVLDRAVDIDFHFNRLNNAIENLDLGEKLNIDEFEKLFTGYTNCALKILVSEKNIVVQKREIPYDKEDYKKGFKLCLSKVTKSKNSLLVYYKTTNYYENLLEKRKAIDNGFNEPIFLNEDGDVTEGATSNIFIVKKGQVYTPKTSCGLLNGRVRQWVLENYDVKEARLKLSDLMDAEEVFITNSLIGIMKITRFEDKEYNDTIVINKITEKYREYLMNFGGASIG